MPVPFVQIFISRTGWNIENFRAVNTHYLSTLQVFQSFFHSCKNHLLQSCPKEFLWFFCECMVNLLKGNLQSIKRQHVTQLQNEVRFFSLSLWKNHLEEKERFRNPKEGCYSYKSILLPPLTICLDMEQFFLVLASVYVNKCLNTQKVMKQERPKHQVKETPTYQTDSLKRERTKNCLPKQTLYSQKFRLLLVSSSQIRRRQNWIVWELEFYCQTLVNIFIVKTQSFQTFTSLDPAGISPFLVLNQNVIAKERSSWVRFKIWTSQTAKIVHEGGNATYGSARNLMKTSKLAT